MFARIPQVGLLFFEVDSERSRGLMLVMWGSEAVPWLRRPKFYFGAPEAPHWAVRLLSR